MIQTHDSHVFHGFCKDLGGHLESLKLLEIQPAVELKRLAAAAVQLRPGHHISILFNCLR
jgi:hypothetical protein